MLNDQNPASHIANIETTLSWGARGSVLLEDLMCCCIDAFVHQPYDSFCSTWESKSITAIGVKGVSWNMLELRVYLLLKFS